MWRQRLSEISDRPAFAKALWICLALLLSLLHLAAHATNIDHNEFILDEAGTWGVAQRSFWTQFTLPTEFHSQPPLYYFVLHFLIQIDSSPWFLRGFSWFCCLLAIQFILFYLDELHLLARVFLCLLFIFSDLTHYLSVIVRPYGMAAFLTLVATVMFWRLVQEPTRRRAVIYAAWALPMLYTMAFEVAVLLTHGLFVVAVCLIDFVRVGVKQALVRRRVLILTMTGVVIGYLPYLLMAIHYQYAPNQAKNLALVLNPDTYERMVAQHFGVVPAILVALYGLWLIALVGETKERNHKVWLLPLMAIGQIAFVYYFIIGRSPVGAQGKYMTPAFVALCLLAAIGFQQLTPKPGRAVFWVLPVWLLMLLVPRYEAFHKYLYAPKPVGPFTVLHQAMAREPGRKLIFFDVGYDGQHLEYVVRDDPNVTLATMRGRGWASGGDNHLTDAYVIKTIEETAATTRCYYFYLEKPNGPYATAFVPTLLKLGYKQAPSLPTTYGRPVPAFCR